MLLSKFYLGRRHCQIIAGFEKKSTPTGLARWGLFDAYVVNLGVRVANHPVDPGQVLGKCIFYKLLNVTILDKTSAKYQFFKVPFGSILKFFLLTQRKITALKVRAVTNLKLLNFLLHVILNLPDLFKC